jgi:hypothetical protein
VRSEEGVCSRFSDSRALRHKVVPNLGSADAELIGVIWTGRNRGILSLNHGMLSRKSEIILREALGMGKAPVGV